MAANLTHPLLRGGDKLAIDLEGAVAIHAGDPHPHAMAMGLLANASEVPESARQLNIWPLSPLLCFESREGLRNGRDHEGP